MHPGYLPVFCWSVVIFVAFLGYGEGLRRALRRPEFEDIGWGLTATWGMALVLAVCGLLMALHLATGPILSGVVGAGAALAVLLRVGRLTGHARSRVPRNFPSADVVLWLLAVVAFASAIAWPLQIDPNDDLVSYLMLPVKLLDTGTLIEPFSFQRAGTFGGQAILQSLVMIVGAERNGHVPDRGFSMLMIFGMLLHATRGLTGQQGFARFLLLLAFWFVPVPRISTNGAMTGGALLLGLVITLQRGLAAGLRPLTGFVPTGLLLAGACSIRPTFTVAAAGILGAACVRAIGRSSRRGPDAMAALRPYLATGLMAICLLIPFMLVLYQSNGTPMIPPISGYVSQAYQTHAFNEPLRDWTSVLAFFAEPRALGMLGLLCLSTLIPGNPAAPTIVWGVLAASTVILHRFSAVAFLDMYRLIYPIIMPLAFWLMAEALNRANEIHEPRDAVRPSVAAVAAALITLFVVNAGQGGQELRAQFTGLPDQTAGPTSFLSPQIRDAYAQLQGLVPAGDTILTMVDASYWFDFRRNPIFSINAVGGSSPPPGLPFGQGPDALAAYFKRLGIRHIIAVDFNQAVLLYTRKLWNESTRPEWFYRENWKPRFNDFMDNIDALAKRPGGLVATAGNARLIRIGE
jgi:hypothetical protein